MEILFMEKNRTQSFSSVEKFLLKIRVLHPSRTTVLGLQFLLSSQTNLFLEGQLSQEF